MVYERPVSQESLSWAANKTHPEVVLNDADEINTLVSFSKRL